MPSEFLHNHPDFDALLRIVADQKQISPYLVEKDYWIMHCLFGLQEMDLNFELKGGTSLSKGFGVIHRFSEDIDLRIEPPENLTVNTNPKATKSNQVAGRKDYYDWLADNIEIDGLESVARDYD